MVKKKFSGFNVLELLYRHKVTMILILLLIPLYIFLYKIYIPRVNAFGCFDDCFNYIGGYFLVNGKSMYADFFYNHQPMLAYISSFIQAFTNPQNIFELILRHRQFVFLFGLIFNSFLIARFGFPAFLFALIFETSKYFIFGDRFLAEGIIVYPVVYLAGLVISKLQGKKIHSYELIIASCLAWFVIFSREPYVPVALFSYIFLLYGKPFSESKKASILVLVALSILTIFYHNPKEYFFNVFTTNYNTVFAAESVSNELFGPKILQIFLYPFYLFFSGGWNVFRQLLVGINLLFLLYFAILIKERIRLAGFIFVLLGLANLRIVVPGKLFYEAFHMIIWYGLFVFITSTLIFKYIKNRPTFIFSILLTLLFLIGFLNSPFYFAKEKIDQHAEHITNYGETIQIGEVVKKLSEPNDTLFLDGSDDLIYWQANRLSSYKYSWYTSVMRLFPKYSEARIDMFKTNPPDFYKEFGSCPKKDPIEGYSLPEFIADDYVRLHNLDKPSCLFVHKKKLEQITEAQWKKAAEFLYGLNKDQP